MIIRLTLGSWRFTFSMAPITKVIGVDSLLPDGNHILMWDFDDTTLQKVIMALEDVQNVYHLPTIYILETKPNKNYIAYCFKKVPWRKAVEIIAFTKGVDWNFFKYGVYRGRFTLRVSPKCGRKPKLVWKLKSDVAEDAYITELRNWVKYETLADGYTSNLHEINIPPKNNKIYVKREAIRK